MTSIEPPISNTRIQRKMPSPFQRPSVSVGTAPEVRREWRTVNVQDIKIGDIVPGIGRVFAVNESFDVSAQLWIVTVRGGTDNVKVYQGAEQAWVFARTAQ